MGTALHAEVREYEQREAMARDFDKTKPLIRMRRGDGTCVARVVWAKFDRIRVTRWVAATSRWAHAETISWHTFVEVIETNGVISTQQREFF